MSQRAEKLTPICPSERCERMLAAGAKANIHNGRHQLHDAAHAAERCRVVNGRGADACVLQSVGHFDEAPVRLRKAHAAQPALAEIQAGLCVCQSLLPLM